MKGRVESVVSRIPPPLLLLNTRNLSTDALQNFFTSIYSPPDVGWTSRTNRHGGVRGEEEGQLFPSVRSFTKGEEKQSHGRKLETSICPTMSGETQIPQKKRMRNGWNGCRL
jgi:hypothetical protein